MERVAKYLRPLGLRIFYLKEQGCLPLRVDNPGLVRGASQEIEIPSAQVKSAVLLAGLAAQGITEITQQPVTRDHTEIMLEAMGADIKRHGHRIQLYGGSSLDFPRRWLIPGDFSGAAWWAALAAVSGQISLKEVGVNRTRTGFADILQAMGAKISISVSSTSNGEPIADLEIAQGELQGVELDPSSIPRCIDELPALAVVATFARGKTVIRGAEELKYKESNRLCQIARMLSAFGAGHELLSDGLVVRGGAKLRPVEFTSSDHRIVMAAMLMAALTPGESRIGDVRWLDTSYPGFIGDFHRATGSLPGEVL